MNPIETPSSGLCDIKGHLAFLAGLGCGRHVVEFGFRTGHSARNFLDGGCSSLISYDIDACEPYSSHQDKRFRFVRQNSLQAQPEWCDLLFIDSEHTGEHLTAELERHAQAVHDVIAMHDTHCPKFHSMRPAVLRFLARHPEWVMAVDFKHCNGLTVIRRSHEQ